jgi:hypothetical protein
MPNPALALGGLGAAAQASSANSAAGVQAAASQAGIDEQRRQFDTVQKLLEPYVTAGNTGLSAQMGLMGLSGAPAQQQAISAIQAGPEFGALTLAGEQAILSNAAATGGLRGGNTQAALAQFRPQVLSDLINNQLSRFGGIAAMGQNAAAGVGSAAQATGNNVAGLLQQAGAARAGGALATGQAFGNLLGGMGQHVGQFGNPNAPFFSTAAWGF